MAAGGTATAEAAAVRKQRYYIAWVVTQYWVVSISMVYLNKFLLSSDDYSIPAPLFVTWFQCVVTCAICWVCGKMGGGGGSGIFADFKPMRYKLSTALKVLPLSLIFVGMISFNNLCLKYVEVSFYNVARSLTIVFNVIFSLMLLGQRTSCKTILSLLVVIGGFIIGTNGEINFSLIGTVSGVFSSMFVSLNSIYVKKGLAVVNDDLWLLTFVNNMNACILFLPLIFVLEKDIISEKLDIMFQATFWVGMWVAGFFGFAIGIVTGLQIKATSPLTHNISGTAKAAVQSVSAFYIWGNQPTLMGVLGIWFVLMGSGIYTYVKITEGSAKKSGGASGGGGGSKSVQMQQRDKEQTTSLLPTDSSHAESSNGSGRA